LEDKAENNWFKKVEESREVKDCGEKKAVNKLASRLNEFSSQLAVALISSLNAICELKRFIKL
jgi:hypothetical protein